MHLLLNPPLLHIRLPLPSRKMLYPLLRPQRHTLLNGQDILLRTRRLQRFRIAIAFRISESGGAVLTGAQLVGGIAAVVRDGCFFGGGEEGSEEGDGRGDYYEGVFYYYPAEEEDCVVWFSLGC